MINDILEILAGVVAFIGSLAFCCKKKNSQVEVEDANETHIVNYYVYQQGQPFPRGY